MDLQHCRLCKSENTQDIIWLGKQYITSRFPVYGDFSTPKTSITLCMCKECGLVQLKETTDSAELYEYEYGYRSGISNTMRSHLKTYQEEIMQTAQFEKGDVVVDIGSNDSTMLQYYSSEYRRIGVDPTGKQFAQYYGDVELLPTYFTRENFINRFGEIRCKVVSSICMFYDLPDPVQFAKDIHSILDDDGVWTCEQSYLPRMIETNSIDTICHEHLEYYALHQVKNIADRAGFSIIDVKFNESNGGSFRVYFAKKTSQKYTENTELVNAILRREMDMGIMNVELYGRFLEKVHTEIDKLIAFLDMVKSNGKKAYIYGASTKGNCLLQYAGIDEMHIQYAVERNPNKIGKMTSTGIEIISEETMRESPPDYLLVLPWHFRDEIIARERKFLEEGGQFVFPFPHFDIVGFKPKILITGCDGMIAHYVKDQFVDYNLYGITRNLHVDPESNILKCEVDMTDAKLLEDTLSIIQPDVIVHLAAISSSQYAMDHPYETVLTNGVVVAHLCEIIRKNGWNTVLFNTSSSEIYKGHHEYTVTENDSNMYHSHPYSIAKIMGHNMVKFYRETYHLRFFNGILFTTESKHKKPIFLLNKVADHIRKTDFSDTAKIDPLIVGDLSSYRNILHASDVADAIHRILYAPEGDDYIICNTESHQIIELVIRLYKEAGIDLELIDNVLYKTGTDISIVKIDRGHTINEPRPSNIQGYPHKLLQTGWTPTKTIDDILRELL